jgi:hypothetical protein
MTAENILDRSIHDLEVDVRVMSGLLNNHEINDGKELKTLRDLVSCSEGELLRIPNFGRKSMDQLKEVLTGCNLKLGMSDEELTEKDESYKGYYTKLNYDIIRVSKENAAKTIDAILDKHKWSRADIDDLFRDHEKVLAVYKKALKELFND